MVGEEHVDKILGQSNGRVQPYKLSKKGEQFIEANQFDHESQYETDLSRRGGGVQKKNYKPITPVLCKGETVRISKSVVPTNQR